MDTRRTSCARMSLVVLATVSAMAGTAAPASGQSDLTLELGASQVGPPLGVDADNARFLIGGLRLSHYSTGGTGLFGSVLYGHTMDMATGGNFLSGSLEGSLVGRWTPTVTGIFDVRLLGYGVEEPFPYRAFAAEGGPSLRVRTDNVSFKVGGLLGVGRSQLELWRDLPGPNRVFEDDLWRAGATTELMFGPVTSSAGLVGGYHHTPGGDYHSLGGRVLFGGRWGIAELRVDRWSTPNGSEFTGGVALILPFGSAWTLRGFFGRTDPDPLTLAQPGSGSGGFLLGRSLLPASEELPSTENPYEVVQYGDERSRVRLTVTPPPGATSVQVLGDFTLWEPVPMEADGELWFVEIDVEAGTHHFGFLVDDEWYMPEDAPDVVPDEWGRLSATLVIEGA